MTSREVTILLVDDDKVDIKAVRRSFNEMQIENPIIEAGNGIEALEKLRGDNGHTKLTQPVLVLLDLNMPRMNGLEFLDELRRDQALRLTVVFVMTTSASDEDRLTAYEKDVAGYILKHPPGPIFHAALGMLRNYWRVVEFPI